MFQLKRLHNFIRAMGTGSPQLGAFFPEDTRPSELADLPEWRETSGGGGLSAAAGCAWVTREVVLPFLVYVWSQRNKEDEDPKSLIEKMY